MFFFLLKFLSAEIVSTISPPLPLVKKTLAQKFLYISL